MSDDNIGAYDMKTQRVKLTGNSHWCDLCQRYGGHKEDCTAQTKESLLASVKKAIEREKWARETATNYLRQLQNLHGKLSMIKHENNKLRKANEKLKHNLLTIIFKDDATQGTVLDAFFGLRTGDLQVTEVPSGSPHTPWPTVASRDPQSTDQPTGQQGPSAKPDSDGCA